MCYLCVLLWLMMTPKRTRLSRCFCVCVYECGCCLCRASFYSAHIPPPLHSQEMLVAFKAKQMKEGEEETAKENNLESAILQVRVLTGLFSL